METILFLAVSAIVMLLLKLWHQSKVLEKLIVWQNSQVQCNQSVANVVTMIATEVDRHTIALAAVGDYIAAREGALGTNLTNQEKVPKLDK